MRVLHISDLHLKEPIGIEVDNILKRFYIITAANAKEKPFDQIVITGDIRNSISGISIDGAIDVIDHIAASAGLLNKEQIHLLPGNHDLKRGNSKKIEEIRKKYDFSNGTFDDTKIDLRLMLNRFRDFFWNLCEQYYNGINPWNDRIRNPHYLRVVNEYALVFINSALCCIDRTCDGDLIIGTAYIKQLIDAAVEMNSKTVIFFAHHPIQNLSNLEETALNTLLMTYTGLTFYWMCGDAHGNRKSPRGYITLYQVGSLTVSKGLIPDFAIYDISNDALDRKVFRFLGHLNNPPMPGKNAGGWKRVYIDPMATSLNYDETLE